MVESLYGLQYEHLYKLDDKLAEKLWAFRLQRDDTETKCLDFREMIQGRSFYIDFEDRILNGTDVNRLGESQSSSLSLISHG